MSNGPELVVEGMVETLAAAHRDEQWPERMHLPDAVEELSSWLEDERQWARAFPRNWTSLMDDVISALRALGPAVQREVDASGLCDQLAQCRGMLNTDETRSDPALRQRLRRLVGTIRESFQSVGVLVAAWSDLTHRVTNPEIAEQSARQLLALSAWLGHDPEGLRKELSAHLTGSLARVREEPTPTASERLAAVRALLTEPPSRAHMVVWLRYIFARVLPEWIDIGEAVRIYRGEWLRSALDAVPHNQLPPEINEEDFSLKLFCQGDGRQDERERPIAYVRIDVGNELMSRAVEIARDTAQALASLGGLYGAEPTLWMLDEGYVCYADGKCCGGSSSPPVVEGPTFNERIAVAQDRTAEGLEELADRLGAHLPVRTPDLHAAATLLGWLREARTSPAPLRLVLFDRVVEATCGWAGIHSVPRFVRDALIPWWAYARIQHTIKSVGFAVISGGGLAGLVEGSPEQAIRQEIISHPPLEIDVRSERRSLNLRGVLTETRWLLERLPENSDAARQVSSLARRTATGKATADWWDQLCKDAERMEARRLRTRNALMHGGPLAPATIEGVAVFAEHLAGEALAACVEGQLLERNLIDYFLDRDRRLADIRAQLRNEATPSEVLFLQE
jgi:hypothetical protein